MAAEHDGHVVSEDDANEVRIPYETLSWGFRANLWGTINAECETHLDEYEGEWLDPSTLKKVAQVMRQWLAGQPDATEQARRLLLEVADMIEADAERQVRVMIWL